MVVVVEFDRFNVKPCLSRSRVDKLVLWLALALFTVTFASVPVPLAGTGLLLEAMPEEDQMREELEDANPKSAEFVD